MAIIDLKQNTPEWHSFRLKHIGASDCPIIMMESPWMTPIELYELKLGIRQPKPGNEFTERGHRLEPEALKIFINREDNEYSMHPVIFESDECPFMAASLDGYDPAHNIILEIKCPGEKDHECALSRRIPEKYVYQLQAQFLVTGAKRGYYMSYRPEHETPYVILEVGPIKSKMDALLEECTKFWTCLQTFTPPRICADDDQWRYNCGELRKLSGLIEMYQQMYDDIKEKQVELSGGHDCAGYGVSVCHIERKGAIDYNAIPELKSVDLEAYRKPSTKYTKVTVD